MRRLVNGHSLSTTNFIDQWSRLAGVNSILACADRMGIRIGVWGGCVRNFILDDRALSHGGRSLHFIDFVDPYSDIDCVIDRAEDWPLIAQSISASVAFAGYHRWEFQTLEEVLAGVGRYARIGAESLIIWHEGFEKEKRPKITVQSLEGSVDTLLDSPLRVARIQNVVYEDPWQDVFDAMRLSRYSLQYPTTGNDEGSIYFPDRRRIHNLMDTPEAQVRWAHNWLRFDLGLFDLLMTAQVVATAVDYVSELSAFLPSSVLERSAILTAFRRQYAPTLAFLGGLVYRQRNRGGLQLRLLSRREENLSRGSIKSIVPWTRIWSLGVGGDDCCRHEDFTNGVSVISWRPLSPNVTYSQPQAWDLAPAALVTGEIPYEDPQKAAEVSSKRIMSIPGIIRVGASLTLRFDHAYLAQFLGRNVQVTVGVVNPSTLQ